MQLITRGLLFCFTFVLMQESKSSIKRKNILIFGFNFILVIILTINPYLGNSCPECDGSVMVLLRRWTGRQMLIWTEPVLAAEL